MGAGGERRRRGARAGCRGAGVERVLTAQEGAAMPVVLAISTVRRKGNIFGHAGNIIGRVGMKTNRPSKPVAVLEIEYSLK